MSHRLYILEGLPCSGKSTTSAFVAELLKQHGNVCFVDEGTGEHPADYEFHALAPAGLLLEDSLIVSLKDYSGEMFDRLLQYKIYDFLPWETEKPVMLEKWQQFVREAQEDTIYVFNCVLLQNPMCETMMRFGFDQEESRQYIAQIAEIIRPMNPVVIYLKNEDIADSIRKAAAERPGWLDGVIDYHVHGAYGKSIGAEGFESYIQCLTERQNRELRILSALSVESLVLGNPQRDWQTARQTVKEYIEDEEHAEIKTL